MKRCLKLDAPEMAKKALCLVCQVTPSSSQICKELQTPCCGRGPGWLSFLDECPKRYFFQLRKLNKYCLGFELASGCCALVDKKNSKWIIFGSKRGIPLHAATATESGKKKNKKGMAVTEIVNTCSRRRNKHLLAISCKNKVLIESYSEWN